MGTTAQKLQRVLDTKEGLKDTINTYLGQDITSAIPFKDYETYIKNFYNNLPKTDYAEGSNITLSNTLKGKLDFEDDIVGIGDTSQKSYTGKNKLENDTFVQGSYLDNTSTIRISCRNTKLKANTTYTLSSTLNYSNYNIAVVTSTSQFPLPSGSSTIYDSNWKNSNFSFTTGSSDVYINISIKKLPDGYTITPSDVTGIKFQIEEGSSVTSFEPYVGGQASPNPSYPQDIEVVRGKNLLEIISNFYIYNGTYVSGANTNQFKITATAQDVYFNQIASTNGTYNTNNGNKIPCRYGETIYFASGNEYWRRHFITEFNSSNTSLGFTEVSGATGSYTPTHTDCSFITMRFGNGNGVSGTTYTLAPIVCKTSDTSYLPYNTLEVVERGKNKLDFSKWIETLMAKNPNITSGSIDSHTDNSITITSNGSDCFTASYTISNNAATNKSFCETYPRLVQEVKGNTKYTISYNRSNTSLIARPCFFYLDENYNYLGLDEDRTTTDNATFTTPSNAKYLTLRFGIYNSTGSTLTISNFMIEESSSATDYEPYQTPQTYQLSLGEYEFAKIGNYVDTIEYDVENDKVYKNEKIGKYTFTGNEGISLNQNMNYVFQFVINSVIQGIGNYIPLSKCNMFSYKYGNPTNETNENYFWVYNLVSPVIVIQKTIVSDLATFKTWLANNKPQLYYAKATPTKTEITTTLKDQIKALYYSQSFTGTTIIEIDGQLPLIIKVRALKGE